MKAGGGTLLATWKACTDSKVLYAKDEFTHELEVIFVIPPEERSLLESKHLSFVCHDGKRMFGIAPSLMIHLESVPVRVRFDQAPMEPPMSFACSRSPVLKKDEGERRIDKATISDTVRVKVEDSDTMRFDLKAASAVQPAART